MQKIVRAVFKLRGTEKEINKVKAKIAALSACEEVESLHIGEVKEYVNQNAPVTD